MTTGSGRRIKGVKKRTIPFFKFHMDFRVGNISK